MHSALCTKSDSDLDKTGKALYDLSYSWSSANPDFTKFVDGIGALVDEYLTPVLHEVLEDARSKNVHVIDRMRQTWARVVELEAGFWPEVQEETAMRMFDVVNLHKHALPLTSGN